MACWLIGRDIVRTELVLRYVWTPRTEYRWSRAKLALRKTESNKNYFQQANLVHGPRSQSAPPPGSAPRVWRPALRGSRPRSSNRNTGSIRNLNRPIHSQSVGLDASHLQLSLWLFRSRIKLDACSQSASPSTCGYMEMEMIYFRIFVYERNIGNRLKKINEKVVPSAQSWNLFPNYLPTYQWLIQLLYNSR